jgi:hypothetical protein
VTIHAGNLPVRLNVPGHGHQHVYRVMFTANANPPCRLIGQDYIISPHPRWRQATKKFRFKNRDCEFLFLDMEIFP